jgi:hypothetical protein
MDQNSTEISHDYRTPTADEVQRMIELAFFQHEHANISRDRRIAALEAENADFRRKLGMYAMLECGQIPQVSDLTKIGCQIWYSPYLTAAQRRSKSVWSLRLTVSIQHHRVMEEINVRLYPFQQFYKTASQPKNRTDALMQICDALQEGKRTVETWCGFVQAFTDGGRPPLCQGTGGHPSGSRVQYGRHSDTSPCLSNARLPPAQIHTTTSRRR